MPIMHSDCQVCGKRPATVHLIEPGAPGQPRQEAHLCPHCVELHHLDLERNPPAVASILAIPAAPAPTESPRPTAKRCLACGFAFADYANLNLFGCGQCYDAFPEQVDALLRPYHGEVGHLGRIPGMSSTDTPLPAADPTLVRRVLIETRLREAVVAERFEEAAGLRDQLRSLDPPAAP